MLKSITEIADEIISPKNGKPVTKQYINQTLKKAMEKVYYSTEKLLGGKNETNPFEVVVTIAKMFKVKKEKDFEHFLHDFPEEIRERVIRYCIDEKVVKFGPLEDYDIDDFLIKNISNKKKITPGYAKAHKPKPRPNRSGLKSMRKMPKA